MKQFKEIETKTIVNEDMKVETRTNTTLHTIRSWQELTKEEKEKEIERRQESIYQLYQEDLARGYEYELEYIKEKYKNIDFDNVYLDSNSQGAWIDTVKKFKVYYSIDILGETIEIDDIDLHIRRYIDKINENDINVYDYYIEEDKMNRIEKTKKYKHFINKIINEVNNWIDDINSAAKDVLSKEYYCPYNLEDTEDKEWLDMYFENEEFEKVETIENIEV